MGRPPCCDKSNVKRGLWTAEEDAKILAYVANHGIGNWTLVPQKAGLNRCGKSCRLRWTNYLRPDLKHDNFTPEEEQLILDYHKAIGSRWSLIAKRLPGRTDNDVKNYWNTKLKKKLSKMGIDPVTHKPFSQILSDYGKISGTLPNTRNQIGTSLNNSISDISEPSLVSMELPNTSMNNKPQPERFQDKSFSYNYSWDNAAQIQRIKQETIQPLFLTEISSTTSSSSSSCSVTQLGSPLPFCCQPSQVPVAPPSPSSWSEFLSTDMEEKQEQNTKPLSKFTRGDESKFNEVAQEKEAITGAPTKQDWSEVASSSANSFVEAILDRDSEMQLEFPEFLNEYLSP